VYNNILLVELNVEIRPVCLKLQKWATTQGNNNSSNESTAILKLAAKAKNKTATNFAL